MEVRTWKDMSWEKVTEGISRKIICGENEMIAHVCLKRGAVVPEHSHVSEQISYILEGALRFWIRGEELVVEAGQVLVIPPNVPHKAMALQDTLDLDIFSPIRTDWLNHTDHYFQKPTLEA
ncbi:MAG: cupin domain-containing protein [Acidobacteriia bacterium]|nr:cupin domain-containing protein [Terriglobia bacterium]